jgi:hypothetical protein
MDAWVNKMKIGMVLLALVVAAVLVVVGTPRLPGNDTGYRTVVVQTHHGTQTVRATLPAPNVAAPAGPTNTLSGDVKYRGESLG